MEKMDKVKVIAICLAGVLLLLLVIIMICGGCTNRSNPEWNFQWKPGTTEDSTAATDTTAGTTSDATTDPTQGQTENMPQANIGVIDREDIENNTQQGNSASTTAPTAPTASTSPTTAAKPTTSTTPSNSTETTAPDTSTDTTAPGTDENRLLTYEEYWALSPAEQVAYINSFPDGNAFNEWYAEAEEQYKKENSTITDGTIHVTYPTEP